MTRRSARLLLHLVDTLAGRNHAAAGHGGAWRACQVWPCPNTALVLADAERELAQRSVKEKGVPA